MCTRGGGGGRQRLHSSALGLTAGVLQSGPLISSPGSSRDVARVYSFPPFPKGHSDPDHFHTRQSKVTG